MYAIILDRNKQYYVKKGLCLEVDFLNLKSGDIIEFNNILLFGDSEFVLFGDPFVENKVVVAKIIGNIKGKKKVIIKFKRRKHHMKRIGHRQMYTLLEVLSIENK